MKKKILRIALSIVGLAVLAGAAFLAPRLFNPTAAGGAYTASAGVKEGGEMRGKLAPDYVITKIPAEELPQREYQLAGTVNRVKDNSIFISPAFLDVSEVEVVVTQETKIYLYLGEETLQEDKDGNPLVVKTKLKLITVNELVENDILSVWAEKRGERYIAEAISVLH